MSLIPFILDLADELQEYQRCLVGGGYSAMDMDDVDFGLQTLHEAATINHTQQHLQQQQQQAHSEQQQLQQQQQQQLRRPRLLSQLYWPSNIMQKQHHHRHHPYQLSARFGCNIKAESSATSNALGIKSNSIAAGLANKPTSYPVINKNGWMMVSMNVKQFSPDELIVKTIDNCIIVEGRHEDKEDIHGVISRHFIRKYMLPKGYEPNEVVSTLSSDGILTVKAPPPAPPKPSEEALERIVDIQQTGPAQVAAKQTSKAANSLEQPTSSIKDKCNLPEQIEQIEEIKLQTEQIEEKQQQQLEHNTNTENEPEPEAEAEPAALEVTAQEANMLCEQKEEEKDVEQQQKQQQQQQNEILATNADAAASIADDITDATNEDNSVDVNVEKSKLASEAAAQEQSADIVVVASAAAATAAESSKADMQVEASEEISVKSIDIPMETVTASDEAIEETIDVAATNNGGCANETDANDECTNINIDSEFSKNSNEKNGIESSSNETTIPVVKKTTTTTTILPAEVPATLDLAVCVPKSIVIDSATAAAATLVEDAVADAENLDGDKNGVETNSNGGGDVAVDVGMIAVGPAIETLSTAGEELVAN